MTFKDPKQKVKEEIAELTDREITERRLKAEEASMRVLKVMERHQNRISNNVTFFFWLFIVSTGLTVLGLLSQS